MKIETIETSRLFLRSFTKKDVDFAVSIWNDPDIGIEWPIPAGMELIMSDKDRKWEGIKAFTEKYR